METQVHPNSPETWKAFAKSSAVTAIPLRSFSHDDNNTRTYVRRDIYLDDSVVFPPQRDTISIYADVLAFTKEEVEIKVPADGTVEIYARVITASSPVHLKFVDDDPSSYSYVEIHASVLDQPVTFSPFGSDKKAPLNLGNNSGKVGVKINRDKGFEYSPSYRRLEVYEDEFVKLLQTQLRMALVHFWRMPTVAMSLCSHVTRATAVSDSRSLLNPQAKSLEQQLAAQRLAGPNTSYFPPLHFSQYKNSLVATVDAADAFQQQYDRFQDRGSSLEDQLAAWGSMLQNAKNSATMRKTMRNLSEKKYEDACDVVSRTSHQFELDNIALIGKEAVFKAGIHQWEADVKLKATIEIFMALAQFAIGVGQIFIGSPAAAVGAPAQAAKAIETVKKVESVTSKIGKFVKSETFGKLLNCATGLKDLYPKIDIAVKSLKKLDQDPDTKILRQSAISGDATSLESLAIWDKWALDVDHQMAFAVEQKIKGAAEFRLALRKHAINGKLVAEARVVAISAGQEFIQSQLENNLAQKNITALDNLERDFKDKHKKVEAAEAHFFDRLLGVRISTTIQMQNLIWAYKYYALQDSRVELDPLNQTTQYRQDIATLETEFNEAQSIFNNLQESTAFVPPRKLPLDYSTEIVESLKSKHSASFTLVPWADDADKESSLAGPFDRGSHFRILGGTVTLVGAKPKPESLGSDGTMEVRVRVTTSGTYDDIHDKTIFHFTSVPHKVNHNYIMNADGEEVRVSAKWAYGENQAKPTPFTQWTLSLTEPDALDLTGLTGVKLSWKCKVQLSSFY
ncbi:hypothetical protein FQN50_005958 [Emmonsiellopsis sp. PD_5]|nr:hypothetical protein FQN50_005958 [Emmonsiellopsis sp. PD_5]